MKKLSLLICIVLIFSLMTASLQAAGEMKSAGSDESKKLVDANTGFAFNIFKQLNAEDKTKNVFISPYSISTALTMTYNGAGTSTKKEMEKTLGFDKMSKDQVNNGFKYLSNALKQKDKNVELNIGNSIWIRNNEKVKQDFISLNKDTFGANIARLDFSKKDAADTINKWVSDATKKKISKIISPPIPSDVMLYLINAVYFKGEWTNKFDKKDTLDKTFTTGNDKTKDIKMMAKQGTVEYGKGKDYKVVRLPYGQGNTAMYCVLPDKGVNINSFINSLDTNKWNEIKSNIFKEEEVTLQIPKFKMEYGIKELTSSLSKLGMKEAFTDKADFTGIGDNLRISKVLHKAVIDVNEEGSEATAVTAVEVTCTGVRIGDPLSFIADRPFLFVIADDKTGTILFMGKAYDI